MKQPPSKIFHSVVLAAVTYALPGVCAAQASPDAKEPNIVDALQQAADVDLSVPASPAMVVLGMSGTEIQRPAFPRDFVASLARGFDSKGKPKNALALDLAPFSMFSPRSIRGGEDYVNNYMMRLRARTTLSLAASQVETASSTNQYAAGVRVGLMDEADPGLYWKTVTDCVTKIVQAMPLGPGANTNDPHSGAIREQARKCAVEKSMSDLWAKPAWYAGYAQGWFSSTGAIQDSRPSVKALWTSYSVGLNPQANGGAGDPVRALLQLYAARKLNDRVADPVSEDRLVAEDRSEAVARLRFGKTKWHAFIDAGFARVRTAGLERENVRRVGLGFEFKLRDDLWLVAGNIRETGFTSGARNLLTTGLRFGDTPKPLFGVPGTNGKDQ